MPRLSLLALVAASAVLRADDDPMVTSLPPVEPRPWVVSFLEELTVDEPWICVLPPPIDFEPFEIGPDGEILHPDWSRKIFDDGNLWVDDGYLGWESFPIAYSDDGDVQLLAGDYLGSSLIRLSTGESEQLPMVPASSLVEPGMIAPAVMVELHGTALSGDGNVVIGDTGWGGSPFRYRAWGTGGLEFLQVPAETWEGASAAALSRNGDIVAGSATHRLLGNEQAVRWEKSGELIALNPLHAGDVGSRAHLVTPDGTAIAGDVYSLSGSGVVPFLWNAADGFQQLGDPNESDRQILVQSLSEDGLLLAGSRHEVDGSFGQWYWTKEEGFQEIELAICDFGGELTEDYTLTGIDPRRGIALGTFGDGRQFMTFRGVTLSPQEWMASISGPVSALRASMQLSGQTMEGAHHRPIRSLAIPGRQEFAWFTGDLGKATRQRDAEQTAGEVGYGMRIGADSVLGLAFGYSELDQDFAAGNHGDTSGVFAVADLGMSAGPGELTLTALIGRTDIATTREGSRGETEGDAYSLRVRYDNPVGTLAGRPVGAFASLTYDHATVNAYTETGGIAPASFEDRSKDSWIGRLGVTGKLGLGKDTDLHVTLEAVRLLSDNQADFSGTDVATGVLDFTVPDVRAKRTWGRLGLDLDHRLDPQTVLSLTLHGSTEGDAFDTAAALSIRRGF